ncbi:MAG: tetratricopeptide repeat protein [Deltaproteobacteria bacterium]|nr:tetratricopeptide repeat protein [Deltaproteobacteria bacterium]
MSDDTTHPVPSDAALADLARELPTHAPDDTRREAVRSSLLAAASADRAAPRPRWPLVGAGFAAGALAAAAIVLVVVRARPSGSPNASSPGAATPGAPVASSGIAMPPAARIDAPASASFERELVHDGSGHVGELVRVHAGTLHVASARAGEHVQLATADARVDGEGEVDVEVAGDQLRAVSVRSGSATLRVRDQQMVVLAAGQTWKAPVITAEVDVVAPPVATPVPVRVVAVPTVDQPTVEKRAVEKPAVEKPAVEKSAVERPATPETPPPGEPVAHDEPAPAIGSGARAPTATEQHFAAGWALLKRGNAAEAARELGTAADSDGDPALAADARYFQAVALSRAGRKTEAERALVAFLDRAPHSIRRGRAAVMLGKLIAERGDAKSARAWFESALGDADPAVVAAARTGLASL